MTDQTQFSYQEPLLEDAWKPTPEPVEPSPKAGPAWFRQRKFQALFVAGCMGLALLVTIPWLFLGTGQGENSIVEPEEPASNVNGPQSTLDKRLLEVEAALEFADPAEDILPYPPVLFTIPLPEVE